MDPYLKRVRSENSRHVVWQKQGSSQQGVVWQHWRALRRLFTCERGAWADGYDSISPARTFCSSRRTCRFIYTSSFMLGVRLQLEVKWKLSSAETYSKMRRKLVPNHDYDPHSEASALRDNMGKVHMRALPSTPTQRGKVNESFLV